ncbi:MAG: DUF309 domain-containing protein [Paracoccaceae bacterium]|nr:DUF309 domain-containing protein [Paracoccaceae bacterium]
MPWPDPPEGLIFPPFAYIPGKNSRHPENFFEDIKASVTRDICPSDLQDTAAFKAGLAYLDAGYFWECHEVLEAVWMRTEDPSPEREMVQALIQLANAKLKLLMDKPRAALRLCDMVVAHLARCHPRDGVLGLGIDCVARRTEIARTDAIRAL